MIKMKRNILFCLLATAAQSSSFTTQPYATTNNCQHNRRQLPFARRSGKVLPVSSPSSSSSLFFQNGADKTDKDSSALFSLSVTELKALLTERGIDFRDCLEKRDLVERLLESPTPSGFRQPTVPTAELMPEENRVISTFQRVSPSVAFIQTTTKVRTSRGLSLGGPEEVPTGSGSGFLWDEQGHVVTNFHVIANSLQGTNNYGGGGGKVKVKLQGMAEAREAEIVGVEPEKDIAVLKLTNRFNLPKPIDVGTSNDLLVGQTVLAIGNPFGLDDTLTTGVVSALGRDIQGISGRPIKGCVQTDAAINPGNSGGPLLDSRGRLIGVNTMIFSPNRGGNVGIGFAIPVDTVRRVVNEIIRFGKVVRPTMGVNVADDRVARSIEKQTGRTMEGVVIVEVVPGSPAEKAGMRPAQLRSDGSLILGDLVTHVNGQPVRQVEDLLSAIEELKEGDTVSLRVLRDCEPSRAEVLKVRLTTREKLEKEQASSSSVGYRTKPSGGRRARFWE